LDNNPAFRHLILVGLAALALAGCASAPEPRRAHPYSAAEVAAVRLDPAAAVAALNAYRTGKGLKPVRFDPALSTMAERQAKAMAYMSLGEAMDGWRRSPEHDANLRIAEATRFGVAIAKNPDGQYGVYRAMEIAAEPRPPEPAGESAFMSLLGGATRTQ